MLLTRYVLLSRARQWLSYPEAGAAAPDRGGGLGRGSGSGLSCRRAAGAARERVLGGPGLSWPPRSNGLDISGTAMRVSAEPFTPAKAEIVRRAGCTAMSWYATGEAGIIGLPCGDRAEVDEVHFMADKLAMIRRERQVGPGQSVLVNVYSSLVASTPKLMLNFVSDDYAVVGERPCGCPLEALGYTTHMHTIRSWEKLTSEGMTFCGHDLIRLIEEVLPGRFGGTAADYQFVETERAVAEGRSAGKPPPREDRRGGGPRDGARFPRPHAGRPDERADRWRQGNTLSVVRAEPIATAASKVMALHVARQGGRTLRPSRASWTVCAELRQKAAELIRRRLSYTKAKDHQGAGVRPTF